MLTGKLSCSLFSTIYWVQTTIFSGMSTAFFLIYDFTADPKIVSNWPEFIFKDRPLRAGTAAEESARSKPGDSASGNWEDSPDHAPWICPQGETENVRPTMMAWGRRFRGTNRTAAVTSHHAENAFTTPKIYFLPFPPHPRDYIWPEGILSTFKQREAIFMVCFYPVIIFTGLMLIVHWF